MGEARRRALLGLPPRSNGQHPPQVQAGQIRIDVSGKTPEVCECGCTFFHSVRQLFRVSALESPIGQEILANREAYLCSACGKEFNPQASQQSEQPPEPSPTPA